jgi:hypothetical protein
MSSASPTGVDELRKRAGVDSGAEPLVTRAQVSDAVLMIGQAILLAVIILIVLGELYGTSIVAEPWVDATPTATVTENQTASDASLSTLNVTTADWYYDNGTNAESLSNASGATLTEGTDYQLFTNGTVQWFNTTTAPNGEAIEVTYSYFTQNTFQALTATFASYGETAYIMVGLGLIALGASVALSFFGGFGSRGGR